MEDEPKVYSGDVTVVVTENVDIFEYATVKGDLTLEGTPYRRCFIPKY